MTEQLRALSAEVQSLQSNRSMPPLTHAGAGNMIMQTPQPMHMHAPMPQHIAPPPPTLSQQPVQQQPQQPLPQPSTFSAEDAEETFLSAFGQLSDPALLQFVLARQAQTAQYLPNPAVGKSVLSQAVLLTMIHRVSDKYECRKKWRNTYIG